MRTHARIKRSFTSSIETMNLALILLIGTTLALVTLAQSDDAILRQGEKLQAGKSITTSNGACRLSLQRDGNLVARRRGPFWPKPGMGSDPIPQSLSWTSGAHVVGDYYATLTKQGNLQVISRGANGKQVVYSTHVYSPTNASATHELVFTEKCTLRIMRQEPNDDWRHFVWTNIHEWLDNFSADEYPGKDNVLAKGEYFTYPGQNYGQACGGNNTRYCFNVPISLYLQHDCNLVAFVGHDHGDYAATVWSAGVARKSSSGCFLLITSHDVALYGGSFDPTAPVDSIPPGKYWSVPSTFFNVDGYNPEGLNRYQVLVNGDGEMYLDWD